MAAFASSESSKSAEHFYFKGLDMFFRKNAHLFFALFLTLKALPSSALDVTSCISSTYNQFSSQTQIELVSSPDYQITFQKLLETIQAYVPSRCDFSSADCLTLYCNREYLSRYNNAVLHFLKTYILSSHLNSNAVLLNYCAHVKYLSTEPHDLLS